MKKIFKKIVACSDIKPVLKLLCITKDHTVATDSFKLLQVSNELLNKMDQLKISVINSKLSNHNHNYLIDPETFERATTAEIAKIESNEEQYPEYQRVMPKQEDLSNKELYETITIDSRLLAELAESIAATFNNKEVPTVALRIPVAFNKPIVLERLDHKAIGLIMPVYSVYR